MRVAGLLVGDRLLGTLTAVRRLGWALPYLAATYQAYEGQALDTLGNSRASVHDQAIAVVTLILWGKVFEGLGHVERFGNRLLYRAAGQSAIMETIRGSGAGTGRPAVRLLRT